VARAGEKTGGDCLVQLAAERINKNVIARAALAEIVDFMVGDAYTKIDLTFADLLDEYRQKDAE